MVVLVRRSRTSVRIHHFVKCQRRHPLFFHLNTSHLPMQGAGGPDMKNFAGAKNRQAPNFPSVFLLSPGCIARLRRWR
ncbi:unnamed protein product [Ciceribacter sp. T2.26MG-112.2]|nr:unnamed protein product [Ciceribacter naphthalenivorans]